MEINHGSVTSYFSTSWHGGFSFQWKIECFSMLEPGSVLSSPEFHLSKRNKNLNWYLEFKVLKNLACYSKRNKYPNLYGLNLCNKAAANIGIDFETNVNVADNYDYKKTDSIESFRNVKKENLLPVMTFPVLMKDDFIDIECFINVKSGSASRWSDHSPAFGQPPKIETILLGNSNQVNSIQADRVNPNTKTSLNQYAMKKSIVEVATTNAKQTRCTQTENTVSDYLTFETLKQLSIDFKRILIEAKNTDVTFRIEDSTIETHKTVLCARSPVFCRMFEHSTLEATNNEIVVTDIRAAVMKKLINYMYTGEKERLQYEEACELYYAADKYEILNLREAYKEDLLCLLNVNNACSMLSLANCHGDDVFKDRIMDFISRNFESICDTEAWIELTDKDTKLAALLMRHCARALRNK